VRTPLQPAGPRLLRWDSILSFPANRAAFVLTAYNAKPISVSWLAQPSGCVRSDVLCVFCRVGHTIGWERAVRAMPSARALLVASLLTEPPCGCLGPSGDDRYRKSSLRSRSVDLENGSREAAT
jgi:hypothetical protein